MVRVESLILIGLIIGHPLGMLTLHLIQKYLRWRDGRVLRARVVDNLGEVKTDQLLEELSSRDDLTHSSKKGS